MQIHQNSSEPVAETPTPPQTEGASTIGFCFGADRPVGTFIDEIAAALDIDARTLDEVHTALQHLVEADYGPLNSVEDWTTADIVVGSAPRSQR